MGRLTRGPTLLAARGAGGGLSPLPKQPLEGETVGLTDPVSTRGQTAVADATSIRVLKAKKKKSRGLGRHAPIGTAKQGLTLGCRERMRAHLRARVRRLDVHDNNN